DVLYNTTASNFEFEGSTVKNLKVINSNNEEFTFEIGTLIIAAGALESTRLLLLNSRIKDHYSPIHSEWLGKCFMDHPCIEIGQVITEQLFELQRRFNTQYINWRKYSVRFSLSEDLIY